MNNLAAETGLNGPVHPLRPRLVTYDVSEEQRQTHNKKNQRRRKKRSVKARVEQPLKPSRELDSDSSDSEVVEPIPLELWPAIREMLNYGKRTHVLGALAGARALTKIADRLHVFAEGVPELEEIVALAKRESTKIHAMIDDSIGD